MVADLSNANAAPAGSGPPLVHLLVHKNYTFWMLCAR